MKGGGRGYAAFGPGGGPFGMADCDFYYCGNEDDDDYDDDEWETDSDEEGMPGGRPYQMPPGGFAGSGAYGGYHSERSQRCVKLVAACFAQGSCGSQPLPLLLLLHRPGLLL
jgi:hypothetical protein